MARGLDRDAGTRILPELSAVWREELDRIRMNEENQVKPLLLRVQPYKYSFIYSKDDLVGWGRIYIVIT